MTDKLTTAYLESHFKDGWWPYIPGRKESLEATTWAAIACRKNSDIAQSVIAHLLKIQNADGGWATAEDSGKSDWSTGAALLTINILSKELQGAGKTPPANLRESIDRAMKYLVNFRTDTITDLTRTTLMIVQGPDFDYARGWPWEPDTYNWIEPTSYALLAIRTGAVAQEKKYKNICAQAYQYVFEKTCTPVGWNFGSPRTLGADWPPEPWPTALALIAVQNEKFSSAGDKDKYVAKRSAAVDYLRKGNGPEFDTTIARALSLIARNVYGDDVTAESSQLTKSFAGKESPVSENLFATAAATIAANLHSDGNPFKLAEVG